MDDKIITDGDEIKELLGDCRSNELDLLDQLEASIRLSNKILDNCDKILAESIGKKHQTHKQFAAENGLSINGLHKNLYEKKKLPFFKLADIIRRYKIAFFKYLK